MVNRCKSLRHDKDIIYSAGMVTEGESEGVLDVYDERIRVLQYNIYCVQCPDSHRVCCIKSWVKFLGRCLACMLVKYGIVD